VNALVRICPDFYSAEFPKLHLRFLWIVPEIGLLGDLLLVFYFNDLAIVVKDTSSKPMCGLSNLSIAQ
jgi:hypothetical protein